MRGRLGNVAYLYDNGKAPESSFSVNGSYTASSTIGFTDTSVYGPTEWSWDFGDGSTSTVQNPTHSYSSAPSTVTIGLTASNQFGTSYSELELVDSAQTQLFAIGGLDGQYLYSIDDEGNVINSKSISNDLDNLIINPDYDEVIVIGANINGYIESYDYNLNVTSNFPTFTFYNGLESKLKNFNDDIYINASTTSSNQVTRMSSTGTVLNTYTFNLDSIDDYYVYSNDIYAIGGTSGNYTTDKVSITSGIANATYRGNVSTAPANMNSIYVDGTGVYITGDFTSYGANPSRRRVVLETNGVFDGDYATLSNVSLTKADQLEYIYTNGIASEYGMVSIQSTIEPDPLAIETDGAILDFNGAMFSYDVNRSTNILFIGGNATSYDGTSINYLFKFTGYPTRVLDTSFAPSFTYGIKDVRYINGQRK